MMKLSRGILYLMTFIVAMCSLIYELLIAQTVSFFSSNAVVWYSLTIGLYLVSMGIGAFLADRIKQDEIFIYTFIKLEMILSVIGVMIVPFIYLAQMLMTFCWVRGMELAGILIFYAVSLVCILAVGILTGLELPLLIKIGEKNYGKNILNKILGSDYFGSLAGGLLFPIMLFPHFELFNIGLITAMVNFIAAVLILMYLKDQNSQRLWKWAVLVSSVFIFFSMITKPINQYFLNKFYYYEDSVRDLRFLIRPVHNDLSAKRINSAYQKIDLVQLPDQDPLDKLVEVFSNKFSSHADMPRSWTLFMDGYFQLWADFEELYHEYFVHMPIQLNGHVPERVLVLGAGDGCLLRELVKYPQIKDITLVEIDPNVIDLAKNNYVLKTINQNPFLDPRIKVVIADAFHYVRNSKEQFDAIYLDFPAPKDYNLSKIFSREFYVFIHKRLTDDGFAVLDAPRMKFIGQDFSGRNDHISPETMIYKETLFQSGFAQLIRFGSYLENDNVKALNIFKELIGENNQLIVHEKDASGEIVRTIVGKEAMAKKMLEDFVNDYREEFFMVKKNRQDVKSKFNDYGLSLNIFNPSRFQLSLDHLEIETIDSAKSNLVNSIMRPTLPRINDWWQVKMPY